ncbi:Methyltransferase domain-containing protein [Magnetospirillum fulvum]|uniref:Methyltransferase domain-containing protein n=2 Tax=Magnetospirillum fulvum TaxID=1082 RepID=A0A1H6HEI6_MAGFU|nr:Methyltransferase domain-containing protein [Magnetospirillum fulvum]
MESKITCRLCGGDSHLSFEENYMKIRRVGLYTCDVCGCLQTTFPDWLGDAYADTRPVRDVWMVRRSQQMCVLTISVMKLLGLFSGKLFDWGGGNGLLVRMLRDNGINAFRCDKYVQNYYAVGFDVETEEKADIVTAFEVFEHADNPSELMREISVHSPSYILLSTELYDGQGADWNYIHAESGKHVFFYSLNGMRILAKNYGYDVIVGKKFSVMYRPSKISKIKLFLVSSYIKNFYFYYKFSSARMLFSGNKKSMIDSDFISLKDRGYL